MAAADVRHVDPRAVSRLVQAILEADGCGGEEARIVAEHLVEANLRGHDSHGVVRIIRYHAWLLSGQLVARQELKTLFEGPAMVHFDGCNGTGQWMAFRATERGIAMAEAQGCGIVALRRAGHAGRVGAYAEQACASGIVSIHFVNVAGSSLVAPFGSVQRCISTAPVAVGVPNAHGEDFVLDFATSLVAEGKALVAARGGKPLPGDALIDPDGRHTGDPRILYGDSLETGASDPRGGPGALRAMGEHKGSGLALACELLAGALTGNGTNGPREHGFGNGMLSIYLDPARLDDLGSFAEEVAGYVDHVRAARPSVPDQTVKIPGDVERATRAQRLKDGMPMPANVVDDIVAIAAGLGVEADRGLVEAGDAAT